MLLPPLAVLLVGGLLALFAYSPFVTVGASQNFPAIASSPSADSSVLYSDYAQPNISPIFTPEVQYWGNKINVWSAAFGVDPNLAATVMQIESCGHPRARSSAGAMGLFQVMPFHFHFGENPYNPETNALRGLNYLARSLNAANGNARLALAGYNGGIGVITRSEWTWSSETIRYIRYGVPIYEDAYSGATTSSALNEWYQKYGAGLCRQASQRLGLIP